MSCVSNVSCVSWVKAGFKAQCWVSFQRKFRYLPCDILYTETAPILEEEIVCACFIAKKAQIERASAPFTNFSRLTFHYCDRKKNIETHDKKRGDIWNFMMNFAHIVNSQSRYGNCSQRFHFDAGLGVASDYAVDRNFFVFRVDMERNVDAR
uniref:Uncharacterized protein n=1 Tax=Romanomermis culicivorax TaxID=13658 RepID=A0A915JM26_ROMCU